MLVAHISDFHVFAGANASIFVRPDMAECARKVVADIATFRPRIDAVMFTGDLTDGGTAQDYALIKSILEPLDMPVFVVTGNHDTREGVRAAFSATHPFTEGPYLTYETETDTLRVIGLDTPIAGKVEGRLPDESIDWLEEKLSRVSDKPTYLLLHHPPFLSGVNDLDQMALNEGGERVGEIVARYPGRLYILSGHLHRPYVGLWRGKLCAVGGSPAFQIALDLHPDAPAPGAVAEPYSYYIHWLSEDGIAVHRQYVSL